jgi:hypothetical protein
MAWSEGHWNSAVCKTDLLKIWQLEDFAILSIRGGTGQGWCFKISSAFDHSGVTGPAEFPQQTTLQFGSPLSVLRRPGDFFVLRGHLQSGLGCNWVRTQTLHGKPPPDHYCYPEPEPEPRRTRSLRCRVAILGTPSNNPTASLVQGHRAGLPHERFTSKLSHLRAVWRLR